MSTAAPNDVVNTTGDTLMYRCPGCGDSHAIRIGSGPGAWGWNGDRVRPTFTPSVLVRSGHHSTHHKPGSPCWCDYNREHPEDADYTCYLCHSFVRDGQAELLTDCTHSNAGKTLPLQPWSIPHG